jgi:hypothetical protein
MFSTGPLWRHRVRYALDPMNTHWYHEDFSWFERTIGPYLPRTRFTNLEVYPGRLSMSLEGAGKRRVFAIGNYVKQRLLRPFHDWLMDVLRRLKTDGTFDQTRPLSFLRGYQTCYSYDLSSATDRMPLGRLTCVFSHWFGMSLGPAVCHTCLV